MSRIPRLQQESGRTVAANDLMDNMLGGADPARDWSQNIDLPEEHDRNLEEMLARSGNVSALARDLGVARTTVQNWRRGVTPRQASQGKIEQYNRAADKAERAQAAQQELGTVVDRHGGAAGLAAQVGVSTSTVNRWMSGETKQISPESQARLARADRQYRFRTTYNLTVDDSGRPDDQVYMQAAGHVTVNSEGSPPYSRGRNFGHNDPSGAPGHPLDDQTVADMYDAAGRGDAFGALDALQTHMTTDYAQVPEGYDPEHDGYGFHFDTVDEFTLFYEG